MRFRAWLYLGGALLLSASFVVGVGVGRYATGPLDRLAATAKLYQRDLTVLNEGTGPYADKRLAQEYRKSAVTAPASRQIDTSRLPLKLTEYKLAQTGIFPTGAGGSIVNVDGTLLVMDRLGDIFAFRNNTLQKLDYGNFPSNLKQFVAHSPDSLNTLNVFKTHHLVYDSVRSRLYVSLERFDPAAGHQRFNVSSIAIDRKTLNSTGKWTTVFESEPMTYQRYVSGGGGGGIAVSGDTVYFSVGDYNVGKVPLRAAELAAQDPKSSFGKVYEYNIATGAIKMKAMGLRNPEGLTLTSDGQVITVEHGPEGGDNLALIEDGDNFGWPYKTFGTDYGTFGWPIGFHPPENTKFSEPLFSWVPSVAPSFVTQVRNFDDAWNGDLLVGSLKAQTLFRLKFSQGRIIFSEPIWIGHRIRAIEQIDNKIVLLTDDPSLIFIEVDGARLQRNSKAQTLVEMQPALSACMGCHHFGATNPSHTAPSLSNILHRKIASDDFRYSEALKAKHGDWTEQTLAQFIQAPDKFAPGSSMPNLNLSDSEIQKIMQLLKN